MNVSLDLKIEHLPGEFGVGRWMRIGEELHREFNSRARELSLMVQGRVIYGIMEEYWPAARSDESLPAVAREYGEIWASMPKVLVSNTRSRAGYNTRIIGGPNAIEQLAMVREETEGRIGVGGAAVATQLLRETSSMSCCCSPIRSSWAVAGPCSTTSRNRRNWTYSSRPSSPMA